ncbi:MAG TPA: glutamate mutase L [Candidatus Limnocylindrales bacterium]|nr:glutamate mutase L [Candidatus Limnocylindrales bacterium]
MIFACVDVGSTFTKAVIVDGGGRLIAGADHRTTSDGDVLVGLDNAVKATGVKPDEVLVCSSAGGGLRLAVVGYEMLVTAQAGSRVGLSAGAKVVHVAAGKLGVQEISAVKESRPDVILLVGGADGGDEETILHNAKRLSRLRVPVVAAGNASAATEIRQILPRAVVAENVLPTIGKLNPGPARAAIREAFLRHVIGGKHLSKGPRFAGLVQGATPDIVLGGVELLGTLVPGDLLVVDVGGATTDVYSVLKNLEGGEVAGTLRDARTVEGDLGLRWSSPGVVEAAIKEKLIDEQISTVTDPSIEEHETDEWVAGLAMAVALRRHARGEALEPGGPRRGGRDLRAVELVVGSGGVLRHRSPEEAHAILNRGLNDHVGGWPLPRSPKVVIDSSYVLAAAGLLARKHREVAISLLESTLT